MLVTIVNHEHNAEAIALADGFRSFVDVLMIDSGSDLSPEQEKAFDFRLPNVYYSGLINRAFSELHKRSVDDILYFICSDVTLDNFADAVAYVEDAFQNPQIGVYAPALNSSGHPQMRSRGSGSLRHVVFVEGACFAVRGSLLAEMYPVDTQLNRLGWGLDVYLGYLAMRAGLASVVDDRIVVSHDGKSGYDTALARQQRNRWYAVQNPSARRFQRLTSFQPVKTGLGVRLLKRLPWR